MIDADRELQRGSPRERTLSIRSMTVCTLSHIHRSVGALTFLAKACECASPWKISISSPHSRKDSWSLTPLGARCLLACGNSSFALDAIRHLADSPREIMCVTAQRLSLQFA
jgi:hypothetical protein